MKFSKEEIQQLTKAWIFISLAFSIVFVGWRDLFSATFLVFFVVSAITVGISFIFHELAHKFFAQKYGAWAEFRAENRYL